MLSIVNASSLPLISCSFVDNWEVFVNKSSYPEYVDDRSFCRFFELCSCNWKLLLQFFFPRSHRIIVKSKSSSCSPHSTSDDRQLRSLVSSYPRMGNKLHEILTFFIMQTFTYILSVFFFTFFILRRRLE